MGHTINGPLAVLLPETKARLLLNRLCILPCLLHICIFISHFFCSDMSIVREYVLLHFVNPICWPASQTLVVFLHPRDQLFEFSGFPRAHRVGGRKQAWRRRPEVVGNVVMVLSAVGDAPKA